MPCFVLKCFVHTNMYDRLQWTIAYYWTFVENITSIFGGKGKLWCTLMRKKNNNNMYAIKPVYGIHIPGLSSL